MASVLKQTTESMARALKASDFIRTAPVIPVLLDDDKEIFAQVENAANKSGAFILIKFDSSGNSDADTPGPDLGDCQFIATCVEVPSIWRQKPGPTPSAALIAEAVANILQNHRPTDANGDTFCGGGLVFQSIKSATDESTNQYAVTFSIGLYLPQTTPSR